MPRSISYVLAMKGWIPRTLFALPLIAALLTLTVHRANAGSTNVVLRADFVLKGIRQNTNGTVTTVRVTNKDILAALNSTATNSAQGAAFVFITQDDQIPVIMLQETNASGTTNIDLGNYVGISQVEDEVRSKNDTLRWDTWQLAFDNGGTNNLDTDFNLWGRATLDRGPVLIPGIGTVKTLQRLDYTANGVGRLAGDVTIFFGSVHGTRHGLQRSPHSR